MRTRTSTRKFQMKNLKKFFITNTIGAIFLVLGAILNVIILGIVVALGLFLYSTIYLEKANVWRLGAQGEEKVAKELGKLDDSYKVVHDVPLYEKFEIKSNIDHVVIGRNGIFVIETKNHNGIITCNGDNWTQSKVGALGTRYKGKIKNPSKQAKRNAVLLKEIIKECKTLGKVNQNLWITAVLVFTNKKAELEINNPTVPVLRPEELVKFIKSYKSWRNLSKKEIEELSQFLAF